jgi:uncharacterized protein
MSLALPLGAPGVYELPEPPLHALTGVRMDVCAFAGVAPRGPARTRVTLPDGTVKRRRSKAVAVDSWDDYVRLYGAFEGPGRLPYAVSAFFDQGGRRAYVVRIVHWYDDPEDDGGVATATLGPVGLRARNEGSWGTALHASLSFAVRPLTFDPAGSSTTTLALPPGSELAAGSVLRIGAALRVVSQIVDAGLPEGPGFARFATLAAPLPGPPVTAEVVEGTFVVDDRAGRSETYGPVGLSAAHPRWLFDVLQQDSELVEPDSDWGDVLPADATLAPYSVDGFSVVEDRYPEVVPSDFFQEDFVPGDEADDETFVDGVHCLLGVDDVSLLVASDLYEPSPVLPIEDIRPPENLAGPTFQRCADPPPHPEQAADIPQLDGLLLDPDADLAEIVGLQKQLAAVAEYSRRFIALLDVPPGLPDRKILDWRAQFGTAFAAGYHPWLKASRLGNPYATPVEVNPSAAAAGIIARRELLFGVPFGPANELAAEMVDVVDRLSPARHGLLHQNAVNVFLHDRDGVRLTAARTLSRDPDYRQLSVRRLVTMIELTLERELQWLVFEPNTGELRGRLRQALLVFLRSLFEGNAFVGATESEAFFVRCDDTLNPQQVVDAGQLICEIGIAPAEPLEFIVLRIARDGDGTLRVGGSGV